MAIQFRKSLAIFMDVVSVEEAEALHEWLQKRPEAKVDLSACVHLHPANLQLLMATGATVTAWPKEAELAEWIKTALSRRR